MRKILIPFLAIVALTSCAHDSYTVVLGGAGSEARMRDDTMACKRQALHAYYETRSNAGAIVGGVLGGAIGGAAGALMDSDSGSVKLSDMKGLTEDCMRQKGYEPNPDNAP